MFLFVQITVTPLGGQTRNRLIHYITTIGTAGKIIYIYSVYHDLDVNRQIHQLCSYLTIPLLCLAFKIYILMPTHWLITYFLLV